jgi:LSD1 subclass zinc finger protein
MNNSQNNLMSQNIGGGNVPYYPQQQISNYQNPQQFGAPKQNDYKIDNIQSQLSFYGDNKFQPEKQNNLNSGNNFQIMSSDYGQIGGNVPQKNFFAQNQNYPTFTSNNNQNPFVNENFQSLEPKKVISYDFQQKNNNVQTNNQGTQQQQINETPKYYYPSDSQLDNLKQISCSNKKCQLKLAYPAECAKVLCPVCKTITNTKEDMIKCGSCKVLLSFPSGSKKIKCPKCNVVNLNPLLVKIA